MTPEAIIEGVEQDGVRLALSPTGTIKARGDETAVSRWLPIIRAQKPGIVAALRSAEHTTIEPVPPSARPIFWERADGRIYGPGIPEFFAQVGYGPTASWWVCVQYEGLPVWINSTALRSKQAFKMQVLAVCFSCRSTRHWLSIYGAVACGTCHPPADTSLLVRWIKDDP